jgi:CHAT domain-containing protein
VPSASEKQDGSNSQTEVEARAQVASLVWAPLAAVIKQPVSRVWLCLDGSLAKIPFNVFLEKDGKLRICEVDSPRQFLSFHGNADAVSRREMLLVGDVDFGDSSTPRLPATKVEVEMIQKYAEKRGIKTELLTGQAPTESAVSNALPKYSYAHIATHGFFVSRGKDPESNEATVGAARGFSYASEEFAKVENPLLESGLILARQTAVASGPAKKAAQIDESIDGVPAESVKASSKPAKLDDEQFEASNNVLTSEELLGMDLSKCKLITLSACESGLGEEVNGQGLVGLRAALQGAGAQSILVSLWPVDDDATRALMQAFYENIFEKNMDEASALRAAQNKVRSDPRWSSPYYWAPWVLAGKGW